jgi:hypothetical protein
MTTKYLKLSVHMEQLGCHWTDKIKFYISDFLNICRENSSFITIRQKLRVIYMKFSYLWQYLFKLFLEWKIFQTKTVEKIKTHILRSETFFLKSCRLWDNVKKNVVKPDRTQTTWHLRVTYWISKQAHARVHASTPTHPPSATRALAHTHRNI